VKPGHEVAIGNYPAAPLALHKVSSSLNIELQLYHHTKPPIKIVKHLCFMHQFSSYVSNTQEQGLCFFGQFCDDVPTTATITRGKSQIWLQVREDSRHFGESCYVLATSNNSNNQMSKYGDIHVFLLRM
jgi:hypothetical protein